MNRVLVLLGTIKGLSMPGLASKGFFGAVILSVSASVFSMGSAQAASTPFVACADVLLNPLTSLTTVDKTITKDRLPG